MHNQAHYDRRNWRRRFAGQQAKNTVRFGQVIHPTQRPLREPTGAALVAALRHTALHYRQLAEQTGRPVKHALFIQFARQREQQAGELEAKLRGRQQPPGELFDPPCNSKT